MKDDLELQTGRFHNAKEILKLKGDRAANSCSDLVGLTNTAGDGANTVLIVALGLLSDPS